jgi:hypothetical protein
MVYDGLHDSIASYDGLLEKTILLLRRTRRGIPTRLHANSQHNLQAALAHMHDLLQRTTG